MKYILITLIALLPLVASAESLLVSAKVLDRAKDGSAVRGLYIYPSVELESGETGSLHIGESHRYPVWTKKVDLGGGVSKDETVYEEEAIGFIFSIKYELNKDGIITYSGKGTSKMTFGTSGGTTLTKSTELIFLGQVELGGIVEVELEGPDGTVEDIALHFGPTPEAE